MIAFAKLYYLIFGILTIAGGAYGYFVKGSLASIIAGGVAGALLLVAYALVSGKVTAALVLGLVVSILLAGRFAPLFFKGAAFMPAGLMTILSIVGLIISLAAFIKR